MKPQTKESFEEYLARVRGMHVHLYNGRLKPKDLGSKCPACGNEKSFVLKKEKYIHAVPPYIYDGTWWCYRCMYCGIRLTSGESDTISIATLKLARK